MKKSSSFFRTDRVPDLTVERLLNTRERESNNATERQIMAMVRLIPAIQESSHARSVVGGWIYDLIEQMKEYGQRIDQLEHNPPK